MRSAMLATSASSSSSLTRELLGLHQGTQGQVGLDRLLRVRPHGRQQVVGSLARGREVVGQAHVLGLQPVLQLVDALGDLLVDQDLGHVVVGHQPGDRLDTPSGAAPAGPS